MCRGQKQLTGIASVVALRADFAAAEQYRATPEPPLSVPIVAYGGTDDDDPTPAEWAGQTTSAFSSHVFERDHFILEQGDVFLPVPEADLRRLTTT